MRAWASQEKSKFKRLNSTPAKRVLTRGSKRWHSERHAVSPSPDPALTTWSKAAALQIVTEKNATWLLASRASLFTSVAFDGRVFCFLGPRHQPCKSLLPLRTRLAWSSRVHLRSLLPRSRSR